MKYIKLFEDFKNVYISVTDEQHIIKGLAALNKEFGTAFEFSDFEFEQGGMQNFESFNYYVSKDGVSDEIETLKNSEEWQDGLAGTTYDKLQILLKVGKDTKKLISVDFFKYKKENNRKSTQLLFRYKK